MKRVRGLCVILGVALMSVASTNRHPTNDLMAFEILRIEASALERPAEIRLLDAFIRFAEPLVGRKPVQSRDAAVSVFRKIDMAIRGGGMRFVESKQLFSTALRTDEFDCDTGTFLYLALGEYLGYPIHAVPAPNHMYVEWLGPDFTVAWEANAGAERDKVEPGASALCTSVPRGKLYGRPLTRDEVLGFVHWTVARYLVTNGEDDRAREYTEKALYYFPSFPWAYAMRGELLDQMGYAQEALVQGGVALAFEPSLYSVHFGRAQIYRKNADAKRALEEVEDGLRCTPPELQLMPLLFRAQLYADIGMGAESRRDFEAVGRLIGVPAFGDRVPTPGAFAETVVVR